jgi:predicted XRE-type DNA-binding protein
MRRGKIKFIKSTGNVFEDLGFSNSEEMLAKAKLASSINEILQQKKFTQKKAAKILGIAQPNVSLLSRGILDDFSIERLMRFLNKLNQDVDIVVHSASNDKVQHKYGHIRVVYA